MNRRRTAPLFDRPVVGAAVRTGLYGVGLAVNNVDSSAVRHPTGIAAGEVLVGIGDPAIVLLFELVFRGPRVRVPAGPELLDELLFLLRRGKLFEDRFFVVRDDVDNVLFQPFLEIILSFILRAF